VREKEKLARMGEEKRGVILLFSEMKKKALPTKETFLFSGKETNFRPLNFIALVLNQAGRDGNIPPPFARAIKCPPTLLRRTFMAFFCHIPHPKE